MEQFVLATKALASLSKLVIKSKTSRLVSEQASNLLRTRAECATYAALTRSATVPRQFSLVSIAMVRYLSPKTSSYSVAKPRLPLDMLLTGHTGSYKQYIKSPERYTTLIPDGVSDYVAGPIMCSASTIYTSLKTANLRPGQWAVFPGGGGGVGIQGVQLANAMGLRPIVVDTGDDKEKLAKSLGAEHFIDFKKVENVAAEIVKIADGVGAHGVFVTAPQSYPSVLSYLGSRVGGKVYSFLHCNSFQSCSNSDQVMCIALPSAGTNNVRFLLV
jgi:NADPH:quinone reductase-like Zn-dependent oxidoreductase